MKKQFKRITAATCIFAGLCASTASAVSVTVNDNAVSFDVAPVIINERTMVPMRAIFEVLGASVDWNGDTRTVTAVRGSDTISLTIDSSVMTVNGKAITLDAVPTIMNDRTLVPVRAISEALGSAVAWDGDTQTVKLTDNSGYVKLENLDKYKYIKVYGYVVDRKTGSKISGASVTIGSSSSVSDTNGYYEVYAEPGAQGAAASYTGYYDYWSAIEVSSSNPSFDILMDSNPISSAMREYASYLKGLRNKSSYKFELIYIDSDDIPELVIADKMGNHLAQVQVLTYYNNTIYDLGDVGEYGTIPYKPRQNQIYFGDTAVKSIQNGKLVTIKTNAKSGFTSLWLSGDGLDVNDKNIKSKTGF